MKKQKFNHTELGATIRENDIDEYRTVTLVLSVFWARFVDEKRRNISGSMR